MISLGSHTKVYLAAGPTDMHRAIDGLAALVEDVLEALIGELEAELEEAQQEQDTTAPTPTSPARKTPKHKPLPSHLSRIERIIDLDDEQKAALGEGWVLIGYETAEQLAVIPRQYYVVATKRAKYAPANDQVPGADRGPQLAARPPHTSCPRPSVTAR